MKEIRQLDTPCYIFEQEDFANNIRWFNKEIKLFFDKYKIGYSFKTNYYPYILKCALEEGCCAEVVSEKEYKLALDTGFEPVNIIHLSSVSAVVVLVVTEFEVITPDLYVPSSFLPLGV